MAKTKFKSLLTRELSKYSDSSEISDYINQTFIEDEPDTDFDFFTDSGESLLFVLVIKSAWHGQGGGNV